MTFMMAHIALSMAVSFMFSNSIFIFSLLSGVYLFAMGLGTIVVDYLKSKNRLPDHMLYYNILFGLLLFNPGIYILMVLNEYVLFWHREYGFFLNDMILILSVLISLVLGIISGFELPFFTTMYEKIKTEGLVKILASDYLGAFFGIICFSLVIFPLYGLLRGIFYTQSGVILAMIFLWTKQRFIVLSKKEIALLFLALMMSLTMSFFSDNIIVWLDNFMV